MSHVHSGYRHEEWRELPGSEGCWEVSDQGRFRLVRPNPLRGPRLPANYITEGFLEANGYLRLSTTILGRRFRISTHRAVMLAFVGPCPDGQQVAHLNGNPRDNRLANLAYATALENNHHKASHGTLLQGERMPTAKLTEAAVSHIRSSDADAGALASAYGVDKSTICTVRNGGSWRHRPDTPLRRPGHRRGEAHYRAKLTADDVRKIRASRESMSALARQYGVSVNSIEAIVKRRSWAHVEEEVA